MNGGSGAGGGPPRLAELLLHLVITDPDAREGVLGDLWEEYAEAAELRSHRYATRWYWWSAIRLALRYATARIERPPRPRQRRPVLVRRAGGSLATAFARDVGYAARGLGRSPGFTLGVALTLGLCIGASATIFGVVNAVVLRPMPFPEPDRLVVLSEISPQGVDFQASHANLLDFQRRAAAVVDLAGVDMVQVSYAAEAGPQRITGGYTTAALFRVLGVEPVEGRAFTPQEGRPGTAARSAMLSHRMWTAAFDADAEVVGRTLRLAGDPVVVVGVAPQGLEILGDVDVWVAGTSARDGGREDRRTQVFGRLGPGVGLTGAREAVGRIAAELAEEHPASNQGWDARLTPLPDRVLGPQARLVTTALLWASALLLLLIGANISNLILARTSGRQKELGVRSALGGGGWGVVRLLMAEGLIIGGLGALAGVAVAGVLIPAVAALPELLPRLSQVALDGRVLVFAGFVSAVEGVAIGLGSALQAARWQVLRALSETGGGTARSTRRYQDMLVVGQVALAMTLLVAAGLLAKSFRHLQRVDPGFAPEGLWAVEVHFPPSHPRQTLPEDVDRLLAELRSASGVNATAATSMRYFDLSPRLFTELGRMDWGVDEYATADWRVVTDDYFHTAGVPVLKGNVFPEGDAGSGGSRVVVGESLARRLWPNEDAVGGLIRWEGPTGTVSRVIGIVGDVNDVHPALPRVPSAYVSFREVPVSAVTLLVRSESPPADLAALVRREVWRVDPDAAVSEVVAVEERYLDVVWLERFLPRFFGAVAVAAVLLAGLGIYGLVSFTVARRGHEIGVRLALGGRPAAIVRMLFRRGVLLVAAGVLLGAAAALGLSRGLAGLLFETETSDPGTYLLVGGFLLVVGLLATYIPSRSATEVDPNKVLPA